MIVDYYLLIDCEQNRQVYRELSSTSLLGSVRNSWVVFCVLDFVDVVFSKLTEFAHKEFRLLIHLIVESFHLGAEVGF